MKEYGAFDLLSIIIDQTSFDKDKKRKESDLNEHLLGDCEDLTIAESDIGKNESIADEVFFYYRFRSR